MSGTPEVSAYSLAAECGSELIATCFVIYLGEAIIANELLAKTKGARMGWLAVAFGFGLSFGVVIMMFGYISAHLNPATCLALWVIGKISFTHFLALSAAEFAGAFLGACLVFLHYLPHFKTVPEPAASTADELLLRSRDALSPEALAIVSYDTRQQERRTGPVRGVRANLQQAISDVRYYFAENHVAPEDHSELVEVALGPAELKDGREEALGRLRRRSVQVCDVHRRLQDMSIEEFKEKLHLKTNAAGGLVRSASISLGQLDRVGQQQPGEGGGGGRDLASGGAAAAAAFAAAAETQQAAGAAAGAGPAAKNGAASRRLLSSDGFEAKLADAGKSWKEAYHKYVDKFGSKQGKLYDAAVVADQNAKLSIFATRPAIYTPVFNFLCEVMATTALIFGALMMYARRDLLTAENRVLFQSYEGMWIGFFVFVCILGLGGPTGIAANPARDFGPRLAHALLPIPGKGPSEWHYSWIPFFATFAGGAIAGGFFLAVQLMNHSVVPRG